MKDHTARPGIRDHDVGSHLRSAKQTWNLKRVLYRLLSSPKGSVLGSMLVWGSVAVWFL